MAEEIVLQAKVDVGDGAKSLKSLKQEFKELQSELDGLSVGSQKYVDTLKKLGSTREEIKDLNQEINAFNPEGKVQAFGNVLSGVASGFAAATGAAALFGGESKDLEKTLVKVQAAMAFAQGIQGVVALGDSFKVLNSILLSTEIGTKLVTAAQWLWNAALNANPIGLVVIALTALIAAIKIFGTVSNDAAESQKRINELQKEHIKIIDKDVEAIEKRNAVINESYKNEIALIKARGGTIEEVNEAENKAYEERRKQLLYIQGYRGQLNAEESKELLALTNEKILRSAQYVKAVQDDLEKITQKNKDENEKQSQLEFEKRQKELQYIEDQKKKEFEIVLKAIEDRKAIEQKEFEDQQARDLYVQQQKQAAFDDEVAKIDERARLKEEEKQRDKASIEETFATAQATNDSLQALSDTFFAIKFNNLKKGSAAEEKAARQQFKINKALAISNTIISTIQGVVNALTANSILPEPYGQILRIITAAGVGVAGTANTAKIASMQFNGGGSAGGTSTPASAGGSSSGVPINAPSNTSTQLNPDGTVKAPVTTPAPTVKAVVVETDITTTQRRVNTVQEAAIIK